jgi:hypothetical protein
MDELAELGVHVHNKGEHPVFSLGVKETAYDPSVPVSGAPFLKLPKDVALSALTTVVDLSSYRTFGRCNLLVLHQAKEGSEETPSFYAAQAVWQSEHPSFWWAAFLRRAYRQSMRTHADDGKIFEITSDMLAVCCPKFGLAVAWPLPIDTYPE